MKNKLPNTFVSEGNVWMIKYKDDLDFNERLATAHDLMYRYGIITADFVKVVLTDFKIPCGTYKEKIVVDNTREVESYLGIPCYNY